MTADDFQVLTAAGPDRMAEMEAFRALLTEANAVMNLVGPDSLPDFWNRHGWDSAQLIDIAGPGLTWADLGAGAGFPGLVLAILSKDVPGAHVWLIDSLNKRCRFLQTVVDTLALPATVVWGRAEGQTLKVDRVTARAVAPLETLLGYAQPYLSRGAQGLFLKGEKAQAELQAARKVWHVDADLTVSRSDTRGRIMTVRSAKPRG